MKLLYLLGAAIMGVTCDKNIKDGDFEKRYIELNHRPSQSYHKHHKHLRRAGFFDDLNDFGSKALGDAK
jgi:hypothetical protein